MSRARFFIISFFLIALFGGWGLRWGLPSDARDRLFLTSQEYRNPEFYTQVSQARDDLYRKIGNNPMAYQGRRIEAGAPANVATIMNSFSSYLIKTHATDEAATLVMLSHIKPQKNEWYPYSFVYGGGYLFPIGAYLMAGHVLKLLKIVGSPIFYYMNPQEIARIYLSMRLWSIGSLCLAACAIFFLGLEFFGEAPARWAMLFFGLAPTCMAYTKYAKPHTWSAALTLWAIYGAVRFKKDPSRPHFLIGSAILFGVAMGTTVSQVVFLPFIVWGALSFDFKKSFKQVFVLGMIIGGMYAASNFYGFAHLRDYLDEQRFLGKFSPFRINIPALGAFFTSVLRISFGWELWTLSLVGLGWSFVQKKSALWRQMGALLLLTVVYVAFQTQQQFGFPGITRLFLAMIGLLCIGASAWTYDAGRIGQAARWVCLLALLIKGAVMGEHFRMDRVPDDNPSKAALWIHQNIPAQSTIGLALYVPHADSFPPIQFSNYHFLSFEDPEFLKTQGTMYAIVSGPESVWWKSKLVSWGFSLTKDFNGSLLQKLGYEDPFTNANFPVEIYRRG